MSPSISIDSDDRELEALLRQLEMLARKEGAFLHPALRVVSREGNLWIESDAPDGEVLVRLPPECLIPIDEASLSLDGPAIRIEACSDKVSSAQKALLDCMLAIYNQGNKLELHRGYSPWSAFCSSQELLDRLQFARKDGPKIRRYHEMASKGDYDQLLLEHFIGSRPLQYRVKRGDPNSPSYRVLMPYIDFFNHHFASPGFSRDEMALAVNASRPVQGSKECLVSYNRMDAMDCFLTYGFVDTLAPFMRSVPLVIAVPGTGGIVIEGRAGVRKNPPPPALADLKGLVPPFRKGDKGEFILGSLIIPGPRVVLSMHRILAFVIQNFLAPNVPQQQLLGMVEDAVEQVLAANEDYLVALAATLNQVEGRLEATPALDQLGQLIVLQRQKLRNFREAVSRIGHLGQEVAGAAGWMTRSPIF
jgi:hypothetical protein